MSHRVLSARRRWRKTLRRQGAAIMQTVGRHPFYAGIAGTVLAAAMACLTFMTYFPQVAGRIWA